MSEANGPNPALYGLALLVRLMHRRVRPWNPPSKEIMAFLFVYALAILTAFSTASAPELKKAHFFGVGPGAKRASCEAREM